jgi:predicted nuclease with TOPRIM domain
MATTKELKEKFEQLSTNQQNLNNKKIGLESEIKTIEGDYDEAVKKLMVLTGKDTYDEAVAYYEDAKAALETRKDEISTKIDGYIKISTTGTGDTPSEFDIAE